MPSQLPHAPERGTHGRISQRHTIVGGPNGDIALGSNKRVAVPSKAPRDVVGLKDYQLGDCLGKGAFGSVYRALNWGTGETVAVKQVKLADLPPSELRVIMLEIDLLKNLNHPNIVKYHGFVKTAESLYIILEYCENGSLHSICKNFGKFPENLVGLYMSQVLHGLLYLHEQGVIHRDIKGANILTTKEGLVKLADFGVATRTTGLHESSVVGTPYWMAPEVIELSGATTASDIWSVGCTVIELLEGKPPYHQLQPMPALFRIVNDDHPPFSEGVSPAVRDFLMQCFQKDPNLRVSAKKLLKHPWIVSARRSDSVIPTQPTKYDEAVKSVQQWNEALNNPDSGPNRRISRPASSSPIPGHRELPPVLVTPAPSKNILALPTSRASAEDFRSPEGISDDNWDDDFATSISPSALSLPHLKPQDNFAGMLSADKLKAFASLESSAEKENWDHNFEGELAVSSGDADPLQTVRPYSAKKPRSEKDTVDAETHGSSGRRTPNELPRQRPQSPTKPHPLHKQLVLPSRPTMLYREDSVEDYLDFFATNDAAFDRRVGALKDESLSPKLFHPSDLHRSTLVPKPGSGVRRITSAADENIDPLIRRTRSELEIQRYAEDEDDEDFSDIFGKVAIGAETAESESGSERGALMLHSKMSNNSWLGDDDDDEDDPFAQLEQGFDEMDLQANIARDKYARLCTQVEGLVGSLKTSQSEDMLADLSEELMEVLAESPDTKGVIISAHGMLPILEILETCSRRDVILRLLKVVNFIIMNDVEIQENLCFVGGIPIISKFAYKRYSSEIRLEAAAFVRQMYQTSTLTLQMFVSCGGLNVLVEFLEEDYEAERDLVLIGVNGVWSVFELQGPTPKNDFCRIFSRSAVLYPLSLVLNRVLDEESEVAELCEGRIVNIFYLFSQAENHVKEVVADRMVLKRVLKDLKRMAPAHQITMLKFIKNLSMLSTTLDTLQNSNAIDVLTDLLSSSMNEPHFREISNQVLNTMYNLCRLSKTRQEDAALNGIIPLLLRVVKTERPLKEFALPILCDMAHSGKIGRKILWQNRGLPFYISLLSDPYWQVTALDAIFIWLQEEMAKVEEHLLDGTFNEAIVKCFTTSKANAFENLLEPLQKLLRLSPLVAASLARPDLFSRILQKLRHHKAVIRLNLLRIVRSICDAQSDNQCELIRRHDLFEAIQRLAEYDSAVLVRNMADELVKSSLERSSQFQGGRRSSSSSGSTPTKSTITTTVTMTSDNHSRRRTNVLPRIDNHAHVAPPRTPISSSHAITPPSRLTPSHSRSRSSIQSASMYDGRARDTRPPRSGRLSDGVPFRPSLVRESSSNSSIVRSIGSIRGESNVSSVRNSRLPRTSSTKQQSKAGIAAGNATAKGGSGSRQRAEVELDVNGKEPDKEKDNYKEKERGLRRERVDTPPSPASPAHLPPGAANVHSRRRR